MRLAIQRGQRLHHVVEGPSQREVLNVEHPEAVLGGDEHRLLGAGAEGALADARGAVEEDARCHLAPWLLLRVKPLKPWKSGRNAALTAGLRLAAAAPGNGAERPNRLNENWSRAVAPARAMAKSIRLRWIPAWPQLRKKAPISSR